MSPDATISEDYAQYFEIRDDGTVLITFQGGCGGAESVEFAKLWEPQDEDALLVFAVPGAEPDAHDDDSWVIRRLECGQYEVQRQHGGTHMRPAPIFAGRLCMEPGPNMEDCVGSGCNRCYKSWCDGEGPPSCGGE